VDQLAVAAAVRSLLLAIGEDPDREGLAETPARVARFWKEFIDYKPGRVDTAFSNVATDQMVVVSGIRVWSLCEHHLMPFWCDVSIGVLTGHKVLGLSKYARIAHLCAHRLQIQERLVEDIACLLRGMAETQHVAVLAQGEHLCMTARGVRTPARMVSSSLHGTFRAESASRAEFFKLVEMSSR
jgi:GTP cyclohydrolase IA